MSSYSHFERNFYLIDPSKMTNTGSGAALARLFLTARGFGSRAFVFDIHGKEISTDHIHGLLAVYDSTNYGSLVYVRGETRFCRRSFRYGLTCFAGLPEGRPLRIALRMRRNFPKRLFLALTIIESAADEGTHGQIRRDIHPAKPS